MSDYFRPVSIAVNMRGHGRVSPTEVPSDCKKLFEYMESEGL